MEKIIERLRQIKNEDNFWFGFFANHILDEFDFDYKQENEYLKGQLTDLEQENDEISEQVEELSDEVQELKEVVDELNLKIRELQDQIDELENGYDAE